MLQFISSPSHPSPKDTNQKFLYTIVAIFIKTLPLCFDSIDANKFLQLIQTDNASVTLFVWLCVSSKKTGISGTVSRARAKLPARGLPVSEDERRAQDPLSVWTNYLLLCDLHNKCLPKFVQSDNASSSIKTANN